MIISFSKTVSEDLPHFFRFQLDQEAANLAAFMPKDPTNEPAYLEKYNRFLNNPTICMLTIRVDGIIAGSVAKFEIEKEAEITYWIDKPFWGKGIATRALQELLRIVTDRPVYGRVAFDNIGSQKVMEKCGFVKIGTDQGFANARLAVIEEYIYRLTDG